MRNWMLEWHPECIFEIVPSKNTFSKIVFSENINFISLIYSSSESSESSGSSEELSESSLICLSTFFTIYLHS